MNGPTTKKIKESMIIKYGEFCRHCGKLPHEALVFLNRRDRNKENNSLENFQFLCRPCIAFRNKIERHDDLCVKNNDETAIKINRKKEPLFREQVYRVLVDYEKLSYNDTINSMAEDLRLSPVTTKRYLDSMTSSCGMLKKDWMYGREIIKFRSDICKELTCKTLNIPMASAE